MTVEALIQKLTTERQVIDTLLTQLQAYSVAHQSRPRIQLKKTKKLHWTQTSEGRKKMAKAQRAAWKKRQQKEKNNDS